MTDLQMHWYKLCDDNLENNDTIFDTIFGENNYNILGRENVKNREI